MDNKNPQNTAEPAVDTAFSSMLQFHRGGEVISDLSEALRAVSGAVMLTGRAGSVTLKVTIKPAAKGGAMVVEDDITTKVPKADKQGSIFFADEAGNLLREDPKQFKLALRVIEGAAPVQPEQLRKVGEAN